MTKTPERLTARRVVWLVTAGANAGNSGVGIDQGALLTLAKAAAGRVG